MKIGGDYMRLIDADALEYHIVENPMVRYEFIHKTEINNAPTIDAVQVVRCKDCFLYGECKAAEWYGENGNGYCSIGDRRKDDE